MAQALLDQIGGDETLTRINDILYASMLTDELLSGFFEGTNVCVIQSKQQHALAALLEGRTANVDLLARHRHLVARGLGHTHFDRLLHLLDEAMAEVGAPRGIRREVIRRVDRARTAVLGDLPKRKGPKTMLMRTTGMIYAAICYTLGMASLGYTFGWLGGFWVPRPLDAPPTLDTGPALMVNLGLVMLFALQHSVMARPAFKRWWTRFIPEPLERSTYVALSALAMTAMMVFWEPLGGGIWHLEGVAATAMLAIYGAGWLVLVVATFWLNHFELFGLRQAWLDLRGQDYTPIPFKTPGLYRWVRHPIYVGWLLVIWAAPVMTVSHLLFAVATTVYILVAVRFEERDLTVALPEYENYRRDVAALIPRVY